MDISDSIPYTFPSKYTAPPSDQDLKETTAVGSYFTGIEYKIEEDQQTSSHGCIGKACCKHKEFKDYNDIEFSFHHQTTIQNHPLEYLFSDKVSIGRKILDVVILNPIHNAADLVYNGLSTVIGALATTCALALWVALPVILLCCGKKSACALIKNTFMFAKVTFGFALATARSAMRLLPLVGLLAAKVAQVGQYMVTDAAMFAGKVTKKTSSACHEALIPINHVAGFTQVAASPEVY